MATSGPYYVDAAAAPGGDGKGPGLGGGAGDAFDEMDDFANLDLDISATGENAPCVCTVEGGTYVKTDFENWTVDATGYIDLSANSGSPHGGFSLDHANNTTGVQIKTSNINSLVIRNDYARVEGIEIQGQGGDVVNMFADNTTSDLRLTNCIVIDTTVSGNTNIIQAGNADPVATIVNCLILGSDQATGGWIIDQREYSSGSVMDHCTCYLETNNFVIVCDVNFETTNTVSVELNSNPSATSGDFYTGGDYSGEYNASSDLSADTIDGTNSQSQVTIADLWTGNDVDPTAADFTVQDTDSPLYQNGSDGVGEAPANDIAGNAYTATTPSIGCFELFVPASGGGAQRLVNGGLVR